MDYFKKTQQENKLTGPGGWHCYCCGIQSGKSKKQRKNKERARRYARRTLKHELRNMITKIWPETREPMR